MKTKILILFTVIALLTGAVSAEKKFMIDSTFYNNTSAEINSVEILEATRTTALRHVEENFTIKALNNQNQSEIKGDIPLSFTSHIRTREGGFEIEEKKIEKTIFLKYQKNITKISIFHENETKAAFDLPANICSSQDGKCSSYCDGRGIDSDCSESEDLETPETPDTSEDEGNRTETQTQEVVDSDYSNYILIGIVVAALILGLFIISGKIKIEG